MPTTSLKPTTYSPSDRELIATVKKAACLHFDIAEADLILDKKPHIANIRFLCYWIITQNTALKDYMIAGMFGKTRSAVIYGVALVDIHRTIYRQTLDNLRAIAHIANNFEKKYTWHIQQINTTNSSPPSRKAL